MTLLPAVAVARAKPRPPEVSLVVARRATSQHRRVDYSGRQHHRNLPRPEALCSATRPHPGRHNKAAHNRKRPVCSAPPPLHPNRRRAVVACLERHRRPRPSQLVASLDRPPPPLRNPSNQEACLELQPPAPSRKPPAVSLAPQRSSNSSNSNRNKAQEDCLVARWARAVCSVSLRSRSCNSSRRPPSAVAYLANPNLLAHPSCMYQP